MSLYTHIIIIIVRIIYCYFFNVTIWRLLLRLWRFHPLGGRLLLEHICTDFERFGGARTGMVVKLGGRSRHFMGTFWTFVTFTSCKLGGTQLRRIKFIVTETKCWFPIDDYFLHITITGVSCSLFFLRLRC